MQVNLVETWRNIIIGANKSWVLFKNGTCVILMEPEELLDRQAVELLAKWGPVMGGSPAGDFTTIKLNNDPGWVVTCHHKDILTYVGIDEVGHNASDLTIGLLGRSKRGEDAEDLKVIHVEDRRNHLE